MWWDTPIKRQSNGKAAAMERDTFSAKDTRQTRLALICAAAMPSEVSQVPSMAKEEELALLYTLAKDIYEGYGFILEGGVFLGSSTLALGMGLSKNKHLEDILQRIQTPIQTFDHFKLSSYESRIAHKWHPVAGLREGSSSLELYKDNVKHVQHLQHLHVGDAVEELKLLPTAIGVEIVFLDFLKSSELNDATVQYIFPKLLAGRSLVIQQDFQHEWLPWIHVTMGFFHEY